MCQRVKELIKNNTKHFNAVIKVRKPAALSFNTKISHSFTVDTF